MEKMKMVSRLKKKKKRVDPIVMVNQKSQARQNKAAIKHVNDILSLLYKVTCGNKLRGTSLNMSSNCF